MRVDQVPQDIESIYEGHQKAVYALDANGDIAQTGQKGWSVETYFNDLAWQDVGRHVNATLKRCQAGQVSPLRVHCEARMTSLWVLSRDARVSWLRTYLDMFPYFFRHITAARQAKYERALRLPTGSLGDLDIYSTRKAIPDLFDALEHKPS